MEEREKRWRLRLEPNQNPMKFQFSLPLICVADLCFRRLLYHPHRPARSDARPCGSLQDCYIAVVIRGNMLQKEEV